MCVMGQAHLDAQAVLLIGLIPGVGKGGAGRARGQPYPPAGPLAGQAGLHEVDVHVAALILDAVRRHAHRVALECHQHCACTDIQDMHAQYDTIFD